MAAIEKISLDARLQALDCWAAVASRAQDWAALRNVALRDALLIVPFAQLLPVARQAFARSGGWMPRIETTQTLARSLGPVEPRDPLQISFDLALDRLTAAQLLRGQAWAQAQAIADPGAFDHLLAAVVQTAQALARAAAAVPPTQRSAFWDRGRAALGALAGPGARERLLARVAFEWAAASATPQSDALHGLRPSAWIVVQAGGPDALCDGLLAEADASIPALLIDTDAPVENPFATTAASVRAEVAVCEGFEDEAQCCAAQLLARLAEMAAQAPPIALIAQDRVLVRRVRALLARHAVPLLDETGWRLSTTRAGATLASLLRAATPRASTDDWLDWLKAGPAAAGLRSLEATLRRQGKPRADAVDVAALPAAAAALWQDAQRVIGALNPGTARPLGDWLDALRQALQGWGAWVPLLADDAGRQMIAALHLGDDRPVVPAEALPFAAFVRWIDAALENASFRPTPDPASAPRVVITPLEGAMLRPFSAIVFPGVDEKRLGAAAAPQPLFAEAVAVALGLPSAQAQREAEALAFVQLLRCPRVTLLRRVDDEGEPLAASPLLERLNLARRQAGREALPTAGDPRRELHLPTLDVPRPLPVAPALLPQGLSASACEALRACPYRFFALRLLRLRVADELDDEVEKRDYGTWLHEVLNRFHRGRGETPDPTDDAARLHAVAVEVRAHMAIDDAAFLPYAASFARLVPHYLEWLHLRDAAGARWLDGEVTLTARPSEWQGIEMHGVIDRVDSTPGDDATGPVTELIDYKTGSAQGLRELVAQAQEDTQLAFYAALMARQSEATGEIAACYLPLDAGETVKAIDHPDVAFSADQLVEGLGHDLARIRRGAPMPALGAGRACEHCDARGLCRRDHWAAP
jgi:ATP-dependent helicase/nuclease subunit B